MTDFRQLLEDLRQLNPHQREVVLRGSSAEVLRELLRRGGYYTTESNLIHDLIKAKDKELENARADAKHLESLGETRKLHDKISTIDGRLANVESELTRPFYRTLSFWFVLAGFIVAGLALLRDALDWKWPFPKSAIVPPSASTNLMSLPQTTSVYTQRLHSAETPTAPVTATGVTSNAHESTNLGR